MEVDNVEVNNFQRFPQVGNPGPNVSQCCLTQPGQDQRESYNRETNQYQVAEHSEVNLYQCNANQFGQSQSEKDSFFIKQPQTVYPQ